MKRVLFAVPAALIAASIWGCPPTGDIGAPCELVRANPDGGEVPVPIMESEIGAGNDIISFGAIECENFVCVRHRFTPPSANPDITRATGTCSQACVSDIECTGLSPQADTSTGPFTCRPLLLDEETLAAICTNNPALCEQLGGQTSPYFCAQGATIQDAGT